MNIFKVIMHISMNIELIIINGGFTSFLNKPLQDVDINTIPPIFQS